MPPAARITDMHTCPMTTGSVPHVGGPILPPGAPTVLINYLPAATVTNMAVCVGPPDVIVKGSTGVFINYLPAARLGDLTTHGGVIVMGSPNVMIGEVGSPSPGSGGLGGIVAGLAVENPPSPGGNASVYAVAGKKTPPPPPVKVPPECAYLNKADLMEGTPAQFNPNRRKATLGPVNKIKYTFRGSKTPADATSQTVTIDGHHVDVIRPVGDPVEKDTILPSTDQMAKSLGAVPPNQLNDVKTVELDPNRNPDDASCQGLQQTGFPVRGYRRC